MPLLSIITVNRNNAEGLSKTIESVILQTFINFEYIIIDGASTDNSIEIIKQINNFAFEKFFWMSEIDSGIYEAMNKAILIAKGKYILFLNSGDYFFDNHVLVNVFSLERNADIICGKCNILDKGKVIHTTNPPNEITFGTLYNIGLSHQSTFIKKKLFQELGLYREDFKFNSDIEFWYRSIILGNATTETVDNIISYYNLNGISTTQNKTEAFLLEHKEILSHPFFKKIIPDYNSWRLIDKDLSLFLWIENKKFFYYPLNFLFKVHKLLRQNFKILKRN
jgi:glycosyltransferase involved in cell wall biosynthesis